MMQCGGVEKYIYYKECRGFYQLSRTYVHKCHFDFHKQILSTFIDASGNHLVIRKGYPWDGATVAIDSPDFMRGSLVHDALYSLITAGYLPESYRLAADRELYKVCREDGMWWLRANWVYYAVRLFGRAYMRKEVIKKAP